MVIIGEVAIASGAQRPGVLVDILQCTEHLLTIKNYPAPNVNSVFGH